MKVREEDVRRSTRGRATANGKVNELERGGRRRAYRGRDFFLPIFCIWLPFCAQVTGSLCDIHSEITLNLHCWRILEVYLVEGCFSYVCVCARMSVYFVCVSVKCAHTRLRTGVSAVCTCMSVIPIPRASIVSHICMSLICLDAITPTTVTLHGRKFHLG